MKSPTNDNIIKFTGDTKLPIAPDVVLRGALEQPNIEDLIIIARRHDGTYYFASTTSDVTRMNWLTDVFKYELVAGNP